MLTNQPISYVFPLNKPTCLFYYPEQCPPQGDKKYTQQLYKEMAWQEVKDQNRFLQFATSHEVLYLYFCSLECPMPYVLIYIRLLDDSSVLLYFLFSCNINNKPHCRISMSMWSLPGSSVPPKHSYASLSIASITPFYL